MLGIGIEDETSTLTRGHLRTAWALIDSSGWNGIKTRLQGADVKVAGIRSSACRPLNARAIARALGAWYARARRDLPWRRSRDPYRVWVSEIMLQQTQVERVKDFYQRFLALFPTVESLAAADEHDVLRAWEGLGYYRRARQMHAAAKVLATEHGGTFPRTVAALRGLPGIGRYTAGAIASIAMDLPEPIVEANSRRVLARLAGYAKRLDRPGGDEPIWQIAHSLVPQRDAGRFNQALMDLGAMVCTPDRPLCTACPLVRMCDAKNSGRVSRIPMKSVRRATKQLREAAIIVRRGVRVLVQKREEGEWWAGLWDFPRVQAAARKIHQAIGESKTLQPLACTQPKALGTFTHTVTHHRITLAVVACTAARMGKLSQNLAWVAVDKLGELAMTSPGRRIAKMIAQPSVR